MLEQLASKLVETLIRWLFPLPAEYAEAGLSLDELKPKYRKWHGWEVLVFFLVSVASGFLWWWMLKNLAVWNAGRFEPAVFHLYGAGAAVIIPAMFFGLTTGILAAIGLVRVSLKDRYAEFIRYSNLLQGMDTQRVAKPITGTVVVLSIVSLMAILDWHSVFRQDGIILQSWFGLSNARHAYTDIVDLRSAPQVRAPSGKLVDRREYLIEFSDGTQWSTDQHPARPNDADTQKLFQFISARSNKPIRELKILE